jgi:hypothetical protein
MIGLVLNWIIGSWVGRVVAGVLVGFVALQVNNAVQRGKGAAMVYEDAKREGRQINAKNEAIRQKAKQPGAADRLLRDSCRDC